ncbi:MAG: YcxB family protein [Clostridia bacterium]|nr:YcxB family protein [Clostridia bacterium]
MNNKMLFKNHTKYSKNNYNKFVQFHNSKFGLFYDIYTIIVLILLVYCFIIAIKHKSILLSIVFFITICIFSVYRIFHPLYSYKKQTKSKTIAKEHEIILYFYEKNFKVREKARCSRVRYWQLHKVYETDKFFYLYLTKKSAILVDKTGFTLGNSNQFSNFIKNKMKFKYKCES